MPSLQTSVKREVRINAKPETVFSYLVDESKLRRWFSIGGTWAPRVGDEFRLQVTGEDVAIGKFVELQPPDRIVFTWGWDGEDAVTKPGSSTVAITLTPDGPGTLVRLVHTNLPTEESAQQHGGGWQHYLDRLAIAAIGRDPGHDKFQD